MNRDRKRVREYTIGDDDDNIVLVFKSLTVAAVGDSVALYIRFLHTKKQPGTKWKGKI